jgi:hypothetical protein
MPYFLFANLLFGYWRAKGIVAELYKFQDIVIFKAKTSIFLFANLLLGYWQAKVIVAELYELQDIVIFKAKTSTLCKSPS